LVWRKPKSESELIQCLEPGITELWLWPTHSFCWQQCRSTWFLLSTLSPDDWPATTTPTCLCCPFSGPYTSCWTSAGWFSLATSARKYRETTLNIKSQKKLIVSAVCEWPVYLMPYTFTVLVTVLVSMHRYCAVCKPNVMACARISAAAARRSSSWLSASNAPQARRRVASLALFSIIYNIPRFFEYESVTVCVGVNTTREVFEISAFGANRLYRIIYANVLYFVNTRKTHKKTKRDKEIEK